MCRMTAERSFFMSAENPQIRRKEITEMAILAILLACTVILSRFFSVTIPPSFKISFSFIPIVIAARYYGAKGGMVVAGLADLMGAILFPFGVYFPGYTVSEVLRGFVFAKFLENKVTVPKIVISVIITQIGLSLILNSIFMTIFYESFRPFSIEKYWAFLSTRAIQVAIMCVAQIAILIPMLTQGEKVFSRMIKKNAEV